MSNPLPPAYCPTCGIDLWSNPDSQISRVDMDRHIKSRRYFFECDCGAVTVTTLTDAFIQNLSWAESQEYFELLYEKSGIPMKPTP